MSGIMNPLKCSIAVIPTWTGRRSPWSELTGDENRSPRDEH
ncbi:MAG: hypothetical protein P5681_04395 [Limnospira sp. PMC 894.15]|nr:hypothetical protein [Limnospira sp. PMC 894.15]MDT9187043.1 hypothetical protein [Limnospira sp. PMC 894.15]